MEHSEVVATISSAMVKTNSKYSTEVVAFKERYLVSFDLATQALSKNSRVKQSNVEVQDFID